MLHKRFRLRDPLDFQRLKTQGTSKHHAWFIVSYQPNGLDHNRYGFVTSRAVGNSVTRNRIRRQLREIVRQLHQQIRVGFDIVFVVRRQAVSQPYHAIQRIVVQQLQATKLWV